MRLGAILFMERKKMKSERIAVSTVGNEGLDDELSAVFGKADTFTIVDIFDEKMELVEIIENPASTYPYGAGPIVAKMLVDKCVTIVLSYQVGFGAESLLRRHNIKQISFMSGTKVRKAVELTIKSLKKKGSSYEI
jgi:predicted Fe-Mo cluster-binding NifX family protein